MKGKRILGFLLAAMLTVSIPLTVPTTPVQAGEVDLVTVQSALSLEQELALFDADFYAQTYPWIARAVGSSERALKAHYRQYGYYLGLLGHATDTDASRLRGLRTLMRFLSENREYYLQHYLDADFAWFDPAVYLQENPDVYIYLWEEAVASGYTPTTAELYRGAVRHYLDFGAIQGRSSGTAFDPAWAILAEPSIINPAAKNVRPQEVAAAYALTTGKAVTTDLVVNDEIGGLPTQRTAPVATGTVPAPVEGPQEVKNPPAENPAPQGSPITPTPVATRDATYTMLLYVCGSDLESKSGEASSMLLKVMKGLYELPDEQAENINVVLAAGGANAWNAAYLNDYLVTKAHKTAVYQLNVSEIRARIAALQKGTASLTGLSLETGTKFFNYINGNTEVSLTDSELTALYDYLLDTNTAPLVKASDLSGSPTDTAAILALEEIDEASISTESTLSAFLKVATNCAKADNYGMFFWDHGGGFTGGVCQDEASGKSLSIEEIRSAFAANNSKFSLLGFDACMMSGTETAYYLRDYYEYMTGSEELSRGDIPYDAVLTAAGANLSKLGENIGWQTAVAAFEGRLAQQYSDAEASATWSVVRSDQAENAMNALNTLSKALLSYAKQSNAAEKKVYDAMKSARVRVEQFGVEKGSGRSNIYDYVDAGDYLRALTVELRNAGLAEADSTIAKALAKAQDVLDALATMNFIIYHNDFRFEKNNGDVTTTKAWDSVKGGNWFSGTTLYIPYYNANQLTQFLNTEVNQWQTGTNFAALFGEDSSYAKLLEGYTDYIRISGTYAANEKARIEKLKVELMTGYKIEQDTNGNLLKNEEGVYIAATDTNGNEIPVVGYDELLTIVMKDPDTAAWLEADGGKSYMQIRLKDAYEASETRSEFSSGDPLVDLIDTLDTMKAYVTRKVELLTRDKSTGAIDTRVFDIIIGDEIISYENISGASGAIDIFAETLQGAVQYAIAGTTDFTEPGTNNSMYTALAVQYHEVEGYKSDILDAISIGSSEYDGKTYYFFRGCVDSGAAITGGESPSDVCLVFGLNEAGSYVYLGAVNRTTGTSGATFQQIENVSEVTLCHLYLYTDGNERKRIGYLEDSYTYLEGAAWWKVDADNPLTLYISNQVQSIIGETDQNTYYFAIEPSAGWDNENTYIVPQGLPQDYDSKDNYDSIGMTYAPNDTTATALSNAAGETSEPTIRAEAEEEASQAEMPVETPAEPPTEAAVPEAAPAATDLLPEVPVVEVPTDAIEVVEEVPVVEPVIVDPAGIPAPDSGEDPIGSPVPTEEAVIPEQTELPKELVQVSDDAPPSQASI